MISLCFACVLGAPCVRVSSVMGMWPYIIKYKNINAFVDVILSYLTWFFVAGEWLVEGDVPEPVVMFLQLIRYARFGYKERADKTPRTVEDEEQRRKRELEEEGSKNRTALSKKSRDSGLDIRMVLASVGVGSVLVSLSAVIALLLFKLKK